MGKASGIDAELDAFAAANGVKKKRGACRICASPHRALYEAAHARAWRVDDIIAFAATKGEELTPGNLNYHFRIGAGHAETA